MLLLPALAGAHATGESYVWLNVEASHLAGRFELSARDLERQFGLELPADPAEAGRRLLASRGVIESYLREHFSITAEGRPFRLDFAGVEALELEGLGLFGRFDYRTADGEAADRLEVRNTLFFEGDRFHRSLLCIEFNRRTGEEFGEEFTALVFSPMNPEQTLDLGDIRGLLRPRDFVWQGVLHIWIGIDHVLFLAALLLTSVLVLSRPGAGRGLGGAWEPAERFRTALWQVTKIVTAFTVAHSITLSLAALDILRLPGRLVESVIALSIVLVALENLFPKLDKGHWLVIVFFGLFHGMGFASVMGELPFRMGSLVRVILAFNIGVELGQLAIVAVLFPILFLLRKRPIYKPVFLVGGSVVIALVAAYWLLERSLGW